MTVTGTASVSILIMILIHNDQYHCYCHWLLIGVVLLCICGGWKQGDFSSLGSSTGWYWHLFALCIVFQLFARCTSVDFNFLKISEKKYCYRICYKVSIYKVCVKCFWKSWNFLSWIGFKKTKIIEIIYSDSLRSKEILIYALNWNIENIKVSIWS
jgi:hypothetical protein